MIINWIKGSKELADITEETASRITSLTDSYNGVTQAYLEGTGAAKKFADQQREILSIELLTGLGEIKKQIGEVSQTLNVAPTSASEFIVFNQAAAELAENLKLSGQQAKELVSSVQGLGAAGDDVQKQATALSELREEYGRVLLLQAM